jgi:hypothetical protein
VIDDRVLCALLEAEPAELRGEGASEVARFVREDAEVRTAALRILEELSEADAGFAGLAHQRASRVPLPGGGVASRHPVPAPTGADPGWRFALGLAGSAAAVIASLMLWQPRISRVPPVNPEPSITATLDAAASRPFAVFATDNPDIAIVWLFDREVQ